MFRDGWEHAAVTTMDRGFPAAFVAFSLKQTLSFCWEVSLNLVSKLLLYWLLE